MLIYSTFSLLLTFPSLPFFFLLRVCVTLKIRCSAHTAQSYFIQAVHIILDKSLFLALGRAEFGIDQKRSY